MTAIELNWFRVGAIVLMAFSLLGSLAITDSALSFVAQPVNGGVSGYTPCKDGPNVSCPNGGSAGFILSTNSTICNSGNSNCPSSTMALGVWQSMPNAATEFMGNTSYRGIFDNPGGSGPGGIAVGLAVGCINPSNTLGASLQLQYANYSKITQTNVSNFVNIGANVLIDNSANNPCPGNLISGATGALPAIFPQFIFRAIGSGGGGSGDNPRFSTVGVFLTQSTARIFYVDVGVRTTAHFLYIVYTNIPVTVATNVPIEWIATNITTASCTFTTDACTQHGRDTTATIPIGSTTSNTATVTFAAAFGTIPDVVASAGAQGLAITLNLGTIDLLKAQTLTV